MSNHEGQELLSTRNLVGQAVTMLRTRPLYAHRFEPTKKAPNYGLE